MPRAVPRYSLEIPRKRTYRNLCAQLASVNQIRHHKALRLPLGLAVQRLGNQPSRQRQMPVPG